MKKYFWFVAILVVLLGAVFAFAMSQSDALTQKMFKPVVEQACKNELNQSKLWQSTALLMNAERQMTVQKQICGCIGENALNDVSAKDLVVASVNEAAKDRLIQHAILNSAKGCIQDVL